MSIIPHQERYLPHEIGTRIHSVALYRSTKDIEFVCRRYKISKASLMRWNKHYDGTPESLADRSHRPHTVHPGAHTNEEIMWVLNIVRRNPDITPCELYGKLRRKHGYTRHPLSLYRLFVRLGLRKKPVSTKKKRIHQPYDTPTSIGTKWQMDVKYVPKACYAGRDGKSFYQYTVIEEPPENDSSMPMKSRAAILPAISFAAQSHSSDICRK